MLEKIQDPKYIEYDPIIRRQFGRDGIITPKLVKDQIFAHYVFLSKIPELIDSKTDLHQEVQNGQNTQERSIPN